VAASRAQDQLWLFHSVRTDELRPEDLRHSLLSYLEATPAVAAAPMPADVTVDDRHPSFDSLFEQRVFRRIVARGYHVNPQVEVNSRRIDLVVTGGSSKLAVECDGDAWHSSLEQIDADIAREIELRRCGWKFWRIRESEFYLDRDGSLATLWTTLDKLGIGPVQIRPAEAGPDGWRPVELVDDETDPEDLRRP
jgi:very-short-patch-repair endonuclease